MKENIRMMNISDELNKEECKKKKKKNRIRSGNNENALN